MHVPGEYFPSGEKDVFLSNGLQLRVDTWWIYMNVTLIIAVICITPDVLLTMRISSGLLSYSRWHIADQVRNQ